MRTLFQAHLVALVLLLSTPSTEASPYVEIGTSLGKLKNANQFLGLTTGDGSSNFGFAGAFNFFVPITIIKNFMSLDLGISNRITAASMEFPRRNVTMLTNSFGARLEISRFFVGAGYGLFTWGSTAGINRLDRTSFKSMYYEGGAIWKLVPELHIVAAVSFEMGIGTGGNSPSPASAYGLLFRLPLDPYASGRSGGVDFDGFRYPFGFMK